MKHLVMILSSILITLISGCAGKKGTITFTAVIESIGDSGIMVTTSDKIGFDKANVGLSNVEAGFNLLVGQKVEIVILPEIRESYPVQVTATKIKLIDEVSITAMYKKISVEDAKALIDHGDVIILDVRTQEEFNGGHIEKAVLLTDTEIKDKAETVLPDKNAKILVYCRSGRRSALAAKALIKMVYTQVYDFGGIIDWPYETIK